MTGVNFQPGAASGDPYAPQGQQNRGGGVQEAIKVLSLRLPRVVGAQAAAPQALLQGTGSGGSRVDSVVNQVMSRIMPQGQPSQPPQANLAMPQGAPSFGGAAQPSYQPQPQAPTGRSLLGQNPRVVMPSPMPFGDFMIGQDGRPVGPPAGSIVEPTPNFNIPSAPAPMPQPDFDMIGRLLGGFTYPSEPRDREL